MDDAYAPGARHTPHASQTNARSVRRAFGYRAELRLMLAPYLLGVVLLIALPAGATFALAFTRYDALTPPAWAGLSNFGVIFSDRLFWIAVRNTLAFVALAVPLRLLGALALALLLNRRRLNLKFYRMAVFMPGEIPDVAYALIWLWIFNPLYGPLNNVLGSLGLPGPNWLSDPNTALLSLVIMSLFQIGEGVVVMLAGLRGIPGDLYESAELDGANAWQAFRSITLPLLMPWLFLLSARDLILCAQNTFTPAFMLTGGGPYYATLTLPLLIYQAAFDRFWFGEGAAMLLVLFGCLGLVLWLLHKRMRAWGYAGDV
jgi:multiple sugar transport system permease protein